MIGSICFSQEKYAQLVDLKISPGKNPVENTLLKNLGNIVVPNKETVGIIPYPDAKIIKIQNGNKDYFPSISLVTSDDCKKVYSFYHKNLENWFGGDFRDCYQFWKGARWEAMRGKSPCVQILPLKAKYKEIIPEAKTEIVIWYAEKR